MEAENPNRAVFLQSQSVDKELRCVKCQAFPISPLECQTCDAIKCYDCARADQYFCRSGCNQPQYDQLRPKTHLLFESAMIQCKHCFKTYNSLNIGQHENECSENSYSKDELTYNNIENESALTLSRPVYCITGMLVGVISLVFMVITCYFAIKLIFVKEDTTFHIVCTGQYAGSEGICLFAFGQFAVGIITFAQFGVGLITVSQFGIGLLFGIGQATAGIGFSIGQVVSAFYAFRAQLAIAFFAVGKAQVGFQSVYSLIRRKSPLVISYGVGKKGRCCLG